MQAGEQTNEQSGDREHGTAQPTVEQDEQNADGADRARGREDDVAERPGSTKVAREHADDLADEWGEESFPGSDPPAHY